MRIQKSLTFDAAHMLSNYEGKCANLHGHTYHVNVDIEVPDADANTHMVLDYNEIKKVFDAVDHSIIFSGVFVRNQAENDLYSWAMANDMRRYMLPDELKSTAEDMSQHFAEVIRHLFVSNNCKVTVHLSETPTADAEATVE